MLINLRYIASVENITSFRYCFVCVPCFFKSGISIKAIEVLFNWIRLICECCTLGKWIFVSAVRVFHASHYNSTSRSLTGFPRLFNRLKIDWLNQLMPASMRYISSFVLLAFCINSLGKSFRLPSHTKLPFNWACSCIFALKILIFALTTQASASQKYIHTFRYILESEKF